MEPEDDYPNGDDQDGMHPFKKALRVNLFIFLAYMGLFLVMTLFAAEGEMEVLYVWGGLAMLAHGAINVALSLIFFITSKPDYGKGALVSGLLLLVIGFSSCVVAISTLSFH